jgi:NADP-dependent 3-hydroxy acid dehydrogenase YdfG
MQVWAQNKTAVIFGGSSAVGSAAAHALAREGADVYLAARDQARLEQVANRIRAAGGSARRLFSMLSMPTRAPGLARIDIVVNATGFMHDQGKRLDALTLSEFRQGSTLPGRLFQHCQSCRTAWAASMPGTSPSSRRPQT